MTTQTNTQAGAIPDELILALAAADWYEPLPSLDAEVMRSWLAPGAAAHLFVYVQAEPGRPPCAIYAASAPAPDRPEQYRRDGTFADALLWVRSIAERGHL